MPLTQEQRLANLARGRVTAAANRAKKKAVVPAPPADLVLDEDETEETTPAPTVQDEPVVVGATRGPSVKQESMTDKVLGALGLGKKSVLQPVASVANKAATRKRSQKDVSADFVAGLVPVLALGIAVWIRLRIKDPAYQKCAPQTDEVSKVLTPLARILARRIEIAGKMSEDTVDLAIAFSMTGVMVTRIYGDYITIKDGKPDASTRQQTYQEKSIRETGAYENGYAIIANGNGNGNGHRPGAHGNGYASGNGHSQPTGRDGGGNGQTVDGGGHSPVSSDGFAVLDGRGADDVISRALAADAGYRFANGLL